MKPESFGREVELFFGEGIPVTDHGDLSWSVPVPHGRCLPFLSFCRERSFVHLAMISAVDWIAAGEIELVYHLYSYEHRVALRVKTRLDREKPWMFTAFRLWEHAQAYEQEIHEMMGVHFPGNPDLSSLFLHNWKDLPPLRKDFDPKAYSLKAYTLAGLGHAPHEEGNDVSP